MSEAGPVVRLLPMYDEYRDQIKSDYADMILRYTQQRGGLVMGMHRSAATAVLLSHSTSFLQASQLCSSPPNRCGS